MYAYPAISDLQEYTAIIHDTFYRTLADMKTVRSLWDD